jgi:hypothetical protein
MLLLIETLDGRLIGLANEPAKFVNWQSTRLLKIGEEPHDLFQICQEV